MRRRRGTASDPAPEPVGPATRLAEIGQLGLAKQRALDEAEIDAARQKNDLRKLYAKGMFGLVSGQLLVVNGVFIAYLLGVGRPDGTAVDATALEVYLGATVVQVIGIVLVITRNLFPEEPKP